MPLVAAAVCPNPPLLVPDVASGAASELDELREACDRAVDTLFAASPDLITIVGGASTRSTFGDRDVGTLAGYGVRLPVALSGGDAAAAPTLPLSITIGAWLLRDRPMPPPRTGEAIPFDLPPGDCTAIGAGLAGRSARVGLLIMGDGSARRGEKAPGYADPRAQPFDDAVVEALGTGDATALADIDPALSRDLLCAGRAAWQVLAGAAGLAAFQGSVGYRAAPYGVQYIVATWTPA